MGRAIKRSRATPSGCSTAATDSKTVGASGTRIVGVGYRDMLAQMLQFALQTTQQQASQMSQLLAQTAQIQQQISPKLARKKSDPPRFEGSDRDDLELWSLSTE
ncbi:hypothetical protein PHYPSEUDO_004613 [Phytophthora pseudosyringae]|uniref:Uncharacterized protein n=1 Tax=Phytophthora pseudosyringae TaxID=221518 RepID=A0A8T1WHV9_9STRA|nr:hypothetical protein PHYPSEUDO_004613 [Phytophthora pseudosyringae]